MTTHLTSTVFHPNSRSRPFFVSICQKKSSTQSSKEAAGACKLSKKVLGQRAARQGQLPACLSWEFASRVYFTRFLFC